MPTKLITSLDELKPGMKTKDGWEYRWFHEGSWLVRFPANGPLRNYYRFVDEKDARKLFLNQEVEVPE